MAKLNTCRAQSKESQITAILTAECVSQGVPSLPDSVSSNTRCILTRLFFSLLLFDLKVLFFF